jgi:hypothetical protein
MLEVFQHGQLPGRELERPPGGRRLRATRQMEYRLYVDRR